MACDEAVYLAILLILFEGFIRCDGRFLQYNEIDFEFWWIKGKLFLIFHVVAMLSTVLYVKGWHWMALLEHPLVRTLVPYLYLTDSFGALVLGNGLYCGNTLILSIGLLILTNLFLVHIMHGIFAMHKPSNLSEELVATAKSLIHHIASFLFIDSKEIIIITSIWRAISMSGHAAQGLQRKKHISDDTLYRFNWFISHVRNIIIAYIFWRCFTDENIKLGFARSAVGHVGYMLVRAGPVFRLGSVYVGDRPIWQKRTDLDRIRVMLSGQHPFITIEVGSLTLLSCLFLYWRYTLY